MSTGYFLPIDVDGFFSFSQTDEPSGWYQLELPTATLDILPGVTVPMEAQGLILQAHVDLYFCNSPSAAADDVTPMLLKAGGSMNLIGREAIAALCILLPGSDASFSIQFQQGSTGPVAQLA